MVGVEGSRLQWESVGLELDGLLSMVLGDVVLGEEACGEVDRHGQSFDHGGAKIESRLGVTQVEFERLRELSKDAEV